MDEENKYLEDTKSLIEKKNFLKDSPHCEELIKNVKEECILYDSASNFLEENRGENYANFNDISKQKLSMLLSEISSLSSKEKLLLYLKIPGGITETDPLRQHQNPLGTRLEINRTINWIKSHLEHDPEVSIPKQDVYNDYSVFCKNANIKPLSTADFGKVMKQVFPDVKPRRLGTRGNSRYCYAAMRKVTKLVPPLISVLDTNTQKSEFFEEIDKESWGAIKKWTEEVMHVSFDSVKDLASHIKKNNLNSVNPSKIIIQRKYMQRYANKKKFSEINVKRKKKRKRKDSSNIDNVVPTCISPITLKVEELSDSNNSYNSNAVLTPMNLAIENTDFQKSNHSSIFRDSESNHSVEMSSLKNVTLPCKNVPNIIDINAYEPKENRNEEMQVNSVESVSELLNNKNSTPITSQHLIQRTEECTPMGPPQIQSNAEIYANNLNLRKRLILDMNRNKGLNLNNTNENDITNDDKDVLLQNLGLPRERVISICNMDKHELDDYLPNIENPDEQDAELLQYFQTPDATVNKTEEIRQMSENKTEPAPVMPPMITDENLPQLKTIMQGYNSNRNTNLKKDVNLKSVQNVLNFPNEKHTQYIMYARENELNSNLYTSSNVEQRNFKVGGSYCNTNFSKNRYNFVPIPHKGNSSFNIRPTINLNNSCVEYNTKMYNPTISASAPTSPNILRQKTIPCYSFDFGEKFVNSQAENLMDSTLKINSNDNLEYRSRSVPLNGPKIEELDSNSELISECNSVAQTPIPQEFTDFNDQLLLNDPESIDITINPLRASQNMYIPQMNNDLQNIPKKMYDNLAQKYAINKSTISRSNPTTPLPLMSIQKNPPVINNFEINSIKQSNKMFDLPKSMPTTPIESEIMFRYSPEIKNNCLIGAGSGFNRFDLKKRRDILTFSQYKDSNHSSGGLNQVPTSLENNLSNFDTDATTEILKNL